MFSLESEDDVEDLVVGTTILGTGGDGKPQDGRAVLVSDLKTGRKLRVVNLDEVSEDSLLVSPYYIGSVAPDVRPSKKVTIAEPLGALLAPPPLHSDLSAKSEERYMCLDRTKALLD